MPAYCVKIRLDLVADGKAVHNTVDLYLSLVPNLGSSDKDYKALDPSYAISFTGDILNLNIIFDTSCNGSRALHRRGITFLTSEHFFTSSAKNKIKFYAPAYHGRPVINTFAKWHAYQALPKDGY